MKQKSLLTKMVLLLCVLVAGSGSVWADDTNVTINFGTTTGYWAAQTSANYTDSDSRAWSRTFSAGNKSSGGTSYSQFGNTSNTCTSLVLTATAGNDMTVTAFSVKMAGASGGNSPTTGTIYLYKRTSGGDETELASASVSGTDDVTCSISSSQTFSSTDVLKVSYVGTAKAIKIYELSYSYTSGGGNSSTVNAPTLSETNNASLAYGTNVTITNYNNEYVYFYTTDGTLPDCDEYLDPTGTAVTYSTGITITDDVTVKVIAVDGDGNKSNVTTASYTVIRPDAPELSPAAGVVEANTTVTISNKDDDNMYFYTDDGTTPTVSNLEATGTTMDFPADGVTIDETKTLKVVAVDENGLMSDVVTAAYTVKAFVHGYTIDFEAGDTESYVDWEFENVQIGSETINAHGGDYYGVNKNADGNATATCSITTKSSIANPDKIKFYISKHTTNTTASNWYVEVRSTNETTWTQVGNAQSATSMTKGSWTEVTRDLSSYKNVYVRIRYGSNSAIRTIDDISITEIAPKNVATPTFNVETGTFIEAQNVTISCETAGATIYYTTDGTAPTNESTQYTGAIPVSTTTTIKAIAYKGSDDSNMASVTLTIPTIHQNIAAFIAANTTAVLNLTGAQVVFAGTDYNNNSCIYVKDATGTINIYGSDLSFATGDILSGNVYGTLTVYKSQNRLTNITANTLTTTNNTVVVPEVIAAADIADHVGELVTIKNTQFSTSNNRYYIANGSIQVYDNFSVDYTPKTGKEIDITGIVITYESNNTTIYELAPRSAFDIVYLESAVEVAIGDAGMATFSSTEALNFTGVDAIAAYYATVNNGKVTFTRIYQVPANTGLLLCNALGEANGAVAATNVPVLTTTVESIENNAMVAVSEEIASLASTSNGYNNYILNNHSTYGLGFFKAAGKKVAAGKAYLRIAETEGAREFISFNFDDATGISQIENGELKIEDSVYNLNGQRVNSPKSGLYIVNGKKVIMK